MPHPAAFALHKLIISSRRLRENKRLKEKDEAIRVLNSLIEKGEKEKIQRLFNSMPKRWKAKVIRSLEDSGEKDIKAFLI